MKKGSKLKRLILSILTILVLVPGVLTPCMSVSSAPDNVYWVGDAGNWTDDDNHWALTSGGAPADGNLPGDNTNVHFDENSFTTSGQTVTIDAAAYCKDMDWTGATYNPTMAIGALHISAYGNVTFTSDMTINATSYGWWIDLKGNTTQELTTAGVTNNKLIIQFNTASNLSLQDDLICGQVNFSRGSITTNNHNITAVSSIIADWGIQIKGTTAKTMNLGSSVITTSEWDYEASGLTLNEGASTINCSGAFNGNGETYNIVNLTGNSTVSGSNTFAQLNLVSGTTQTITFTDGTTQTITSDADLSGSIGHIHTLKGSGTSGWNLRYTGDGYLNYDYLSLSYSTATPDLTWYAGENSIDGTHNAGWYYIDLPWPPLISSIVDIADAQYMGSIRAPNSSYTAMDVGVPFDLDTDNMIDSGYINGDCSNTALTLPDGTPIPYMPAVEGFDDWVFYISQITQNSVQNYNLYTGGGTDMDGDIVYFPGDGGMTVADDAGLEPGDSFGIEVSGYVDTTSGSDNNIVFKDEAFQFYISGASEITARIDKLAGGATENDISNIAAETSDSFQVYGNNYLCQTFAVTADTYLQGITLRGYKFGTTTITAELKALDMNGKPTGAALTTGTAAGSTWSAAVGVYSVGTINITPYRMQAGVSYGIVIKGSGADTGNSVRFSHDNANNYAGGQAFTSVNAGVDWTGQAYDFYFVIQGLLPDYLSVTATDIADGEHIIKVTADGTDINLYIDGVLEDTAALGGVSVLDNTNDWVFCENGSVLYLRSAKVSVGGALRGYWVWENSTIFTDLSGNENHATPTFRNVSSDADVSASLIAFTPIATAVYEAEEEVISPIITTTLTAPDGLYEASGVRLPGADLINELLDTADIPHTLFWYPLLFGMAALLGLLTYFFARDIMIQSVVNGACLAFFGIMNGIPFWGVIPFILMALAVVISRKTVSL